MADVSETQKFLTERKRNYAGSFKGKDGEMVLADLASFCRADESTFHEDPRVEGILQGRREVWLRISKHLNLTPEQLVRHFNPTGV